jgi:hypothetical protein
MVPIMDDDRDLLWLPIMVNDKDLLWVFDMGMIRKLAKINFEE